MEDFEFHNPTEVLFGEDAEIRVGIEIASRGFHRVPVHFGGTCLTETEVLDRIHQSSTGAGLSYLDSGGVVPNPRLSHAKESIALYKKGGVGFILGMGGGNTIDSAKAVAYGLADGFDLEDLFLGEVKTNKITPIGCITTIAATGSETGNSAVVTIETKGQGILKRSYNHDCAGPLFAVTNPEFTYTPPTYQMSSEATNIMIRTMERYIIQTKNVELSGHISEGLPITVRDTTFKVLKNPQDYEARADLMWTGSLSHNGLTGTGRINNFPVHKLGRELNAMFNIAHSASLTATWGSWTRTVYKGNLAWFARLAVGAFRMGLNYDGLEETALTGIGAQDDWCVKVGMPIIVTDLLNFTSAEAQIDEMAEKAAATGRGVIGLFHRLNKQDLIAIYKKAL